MIGQEPILRTLINALLQQRLHHAYLFTGTRGVGKTTLARILAKCLNCETVFERKKKRNVFCFYLFFCNFRLTVKMKISLIYQLMLKKIHQ